MGRLTIDSIPMFSPLVGFTNTLRADDPAYAEMLSAVLSDVHEDWLAASSSTDETSRYNAAWSFKKDVERELELATEAGDERLVAGFARLFFKLKKVATIVHRLHAEAETLWSNNLNSGFDLSRQTVLASIRIGTLYAELIEAAADYDTYAHTFVGSLTDSRYDYLNPARRRIAPKGGEAKTA